MSKPPIRTIPAFTLEMGKLSYDLDPSEEVAIDLSNLTAECVEQGQRYLFWGWLCSQLQLRVSKLEAAQKQAYARLDQDIRAEALSMGAKTTEASISNRIITHPEYVEAESTVFEATSQLELVRTIVTGFYKRFDALSDFKKAEMSELRHMGRTGDTSPEK